MNTKISHYGLSIFFNKLVKIYKENLTKPEQNLKIAYLVLEKRYKLVDRQYLTSQLEELDTAYNTKGLITQKVDLIIETLIGCKVIAKELKGILFYIIQVIFHVVY